METSLNGKQSTLIAGNNITITNNKISASGGGGITQEQLDEKQETLTPFSNLSINKVSALSDITAGGNLLFMDNNGTKKVKTEFQQVIQQLIINKIK